MGVISTNLFEMISDPEGINLSVDTNPRTFKKVYLKEIVPLQ